jgi:hypothetical protein
MKYTWTLIHCWLSIILVTSFAVIEKRLAPCTTFLLELRTTSCIAITNLSQIPFVQFFLRLSFTFRIQNNTLIVLNLHIGWLSWKVEKWWWIETCFGGIKDEHQILANSRVFFNLCQCGSSYFWWVDSLLKSQSPITTAKETTIVCFSA